MFGQRVGFLKFKADIVDQETKAKVITMSQDYTTLCNFKVCLQLKCM